MVSTAILLPALAILLVSALLFHTQLRSKGSEPPLIKGYLPFLGVAINFLTDPGPFLAKLRQTKGWIYTVYVAGRKMTVVSDPIYGMKQVWTQGRVFSALDFFTFLNKQLFVYTDAINYNPAFQNALRTCVVKILSDKSKMAVIGHDLRQIYRSFLDEKSGFCEDSEVVELYQFGRYKMYAASAMSLFGPSFPVEELYRDYVGFEDNMMTFIRQTPYIFNPAGYKARARVLDRLGKFFIDQNQSENSTELLRGLIAEFTKPEFSYTNQEDFAGYFLSIMFATKSNSVPAAFWYLTYVIGDPELKTEIVELIVKHYIKDKKDFDWDALYADQLLVSCFKETARLTANITSGRYITRDAVIKIADPLHPVESGKPNTKDYYVHKGDSILMISNLVHWDPEAYPKPMKWIGKRFLPENDGVLAKHTEEWRSYVPWGGGGHMCPGRSLALIEAITQVVYVLWYFETEPVSELPELVIKDKYGGGVLRPDRPFNVKFTRRSSPLA
ncbi:cytochrome P450 [Lipomyces arxii]|uniref:cytochrome P450 n=1 Tax=Lipomyces arxii TaxID=56418 RepID=UPI0034CF3B2F